jgi:hypothetical protein
MADVDVTLTFAAGKGKASVVTLSQGGHTMAFRRSP